MAGLLLAFRLTVFKLAQRYFTSVSNGNLRPARVG